MSIDSESYAIRVTPRRPDSIWSAVNVRRAGDLVRSGQMRDPGLAVFSRRDAARTNRYSSERERVQLEDSRLRRFRANVRAWSYFASQPPSYRKTAVWWVESAKLEATREKRFAALLTDSAAGLRVAPLRRTGQPEAP